MGKCQKLMLRQTIMIFEGPKTCNDSRIWILNHCNQSQHIQNWCNDAQKQYCNIRPKNNYQNQCLNCRKWCNTDENNFLMVKSHKIDKPGKYEVQILKNKQTKFFEADLDFCMHSDKLTSLNDVQILNYILKVQSTKSHFFKMIKLQ